MIKMIGSENCGACKMAQQVLKNKGIDYEYTMLTELSKEDADRYMSIARKNGMLNMPFIFKEEKQITLQEAIK